MNKLKFTALVLIFVIVLCQLLISCGDNTKSETSNSDNGVVNNANDDANDEDNSTVSEDLYAYPEHNFNGAVINILSRKDGWADGSQDFDDLYVESEIGEVLNDAVYRRNRVVEEKYNVEIKVTHVDDPNNIILRSVRAGDDEYQLMQEKLIFMSATLATQGFLYDLKNVESLNLDAPWYNQNAIKDLSINNKVTTLGGDIAVSDKSGVIMAVFNKKMVVDYGIENLYETVRQGKWTLDKLYELMIQTAVDLNGDGRMTIQDDQWGLVCEDYAGWMFSVASGNRLANLNENGLPYMTTITEKAVNDHEKIKMVLYEQTARVGTGDSAEYERVFTENRSLFAIGMLSQFTAIRAMENDFGIIPLPKQDENQQNYVTTISPWVSRFIAMPTTCGNPEMVGAVVDAMSRESTNTVVPAYYDNLLNQKIARDEESVEMLKQIFASVIYDIGSVFNWGDIWNLQYQFINGANQDYVGFHERYEGRIESALANTIEAMQQFD